MIRYNKYDVVRKQSPFPWDAVASGVGSIVSGIVSRKNNKDNIKMQRETNQMQMDMFQRQLDYNLAAEQRARNYAIEDFNMENEYNSPAAQRARYEAAGLNPALMMQGQGSAVGQIEATGGAQAPAAPHLDAPRSEDWVSPMIDRTFQYFQQFMQMRKADEEITALGLDNQFKAMYNQEQLREIGQKIKNMGEDERLKEWQRKNLEKQAEILDDTVALNAMTFNDRQNSQRVMNYYYDSLGRKLNEEAIAEKIRNKFVKQLERQKIRLNEAQIGQMIATALELKSRVKVNDSMAAYQTLKTVGEGLVPGTKEYDLVRESLEKALRQQGADYWNPFKYIGLGTAVSLGFGKKF